MNTAKISLFTLLLASSPLTASALDSYDELVRINEDLISVGTPAYVDGAPDFGEAAVKLQLKELSQIEKRLSKLDVTSWETPQQIDYLLAWSKLNNQLFNHRVMRPWSRDPLFYLYQIKDVPYADAPANEAEKAQLEEQLKSVSVKINNAKRNLSEPVDELAKLTIFLLNNFDGVGQGEPYRDQPPEGTIAWFYDLCQRLKTSDSALVSECETATDAVVGYSDWLNENLDSMSSDAAIGTDNFNWYLLHVRLLPYTVADLKGIGSREFHRYRFMYEVERNKNRNLPELALTQSAEQHEERTRDAEQRTRDILAEQGLLTIPDYIPQTFESDTYWSPRAISDRHFWEELQFRNALDNHIHASFPGHRFDGEMNKRQENPIRKTHQESARSEGWATYLEELLLLAGITDDNPRATELILAALIKRGSRFYAEIGMHTGEITLEEANAYMHDWVPYMEEDLGRYDLAGYLRRPGLGSMYLTGKTQIEQLISELSFEQGNAFQLGEFHDDFLSRGQIPITLIRWEMTGFDDQVRKIWPQVVGKPFPGAD